jgi:hypothetical protein
VPLLPFGLTYKLIAEKEGPSDGLVPVSSQKWTTKIDGKKDVKQNDFPIEADHLNQMGWWKHNELFSPRRHEHEETVRNVYLEIARSVEHL